MRKIAGSIGMFGLAVLLLLVGACASSAGLPHRQTVIVVPGLGGSAAEWRAAVERLHDTDVLVVEWPAAAGLEEAVRLVTAAVPAHGPPVTLVGHSIGSVIALQYALNNPGRAASLVLFEPPGNLHALPSDQVTKLIAALEGTSGHAVAGAIWKSMVGGLQGDNAALINEELARLSPTSIAALYRQLREFDPTAAAHRITVPIVVAGRAQMIDPGVHGLESPTTRYVTMSGDTHWLHLTQPDSVAALIRSVF